MALLYIKCSMRRFTSMKAPCFSIFVISLALSLTMPSPSLSRTSFWLTFVGVCFVSAGIALVHIDSTLSKFEYFVSLFVFVSFIWCSYVLQVHSVIRICFWLDKVLNSYKNSFWPWFCIYCKVKFSILIFIWYSFICRGFLLIISNKNKYSSMLK